MPKRTNEFQQLIHSIHLQLADRATVLESQMVKDRVTGIAREVDILIEINEPGVRALVGVECKAEARPLSIEVVEQTYAKYQNLVDKVMIVSKSGFRRNALAAAEKYGMETLTLEEAKAADWTRVVGKMSHLYAAIPLVQPIAGYAVSALYDPSARQTDLSPTTLMYLPTGEQATADAVARDMLNRPEIMRKLIETFQDPGPYVFDLTCQFVAGTYVVDESGQKFELAAAVFRVQMLMPPRIPVELHHKSYQGTPIAYGTLILPDADALLTVVEAPGKPPSADLRFSPKRAASKPGVKHNRVGK